ncbi:MAG: DMT family transporter [Nitrososphaerales archaeon]|nr:DMT family transporter [Nitrososphaerales archaeon]
MRRDRTVALAQTTVTAVLWGTSFPVISVAISSGLDPRTFVFLRFAIAAPVMLAVAGLYGKGTRRLLRSRAVWVIGLFNATGFVCQFLGQALTTASVAALLVNLSVVLAALGSMLFLREKMTTVRASGVAFAFAGTALLTTNGDLSGLTGGQLLGDALYLLAAVAWAGYIVYAKKKTDEKDWDPLAVSACIVAVTAFLVFPVALTAGLSFALSTASWEAVLYTAVFNTAIPFALYQAGLRYLTATSSAIVLMLEIVTAVAISTLFLGEVLGVASWTGAVLVLVSVLLVSGFEISGKSLSVYQRR